MRVLQSSFAGRYSNSPKMSKVGNNLQSNFNSNSATSPRPMSPLKFLGLAASLEALFYVFFSGLTRYIRAA